MKHFDSDVPMAIRLKVKALVQAFHDDYLDWSSLKVETLGCNRIDEISGVSYSGFIPFQDGGYQCSDFIANGHSSGSYPLAVIREAEEVNQSNMIEQFISDNQLEIDPQEFDYNELSEDLKRDFESYESEWLEPYLLTFQCFTAVRNKHGFKEGVHIDLSINYRDAPYYRDKYADSITGFVLSFEEFMTLSNVEICEKVLKGFKEAE